ncbi:MAG: chorismate--pyruvate lyase [Oscillospiraceae bacterium]|nr:chorismate--pyruvate lyase [Oscillospiraceae bacterium]
MEMHDYEIVDIQGDYAQLKQLDADNSELFPVAIALLPFGSDVGTRLHGMMGMFEIVE